MDEWIKERFELSSGRIREIEKECEVRPPYSDYFLRTAAFISKVLDCREAVRDGSMSGKSLEESAQINQSLYQELLPENYESSYANPAYAVQMTGEYGQILSFFYAELRGMIVYAYEQKDWDITILLETYLELYTAFADPDLPSKEIVSEILKSYVSDYCQDFLNQRVKEAVDPDEDFAYRIIMESDLTDPRYLYKYGEYISENELELVRHFNAMDQDKIKLIAETYTEGYRKGFILGRKDLSRKNTVNIRYPLGFELVVKEAIHLFKEMGLRPVIYRCASHVISKKGIARIGFSGGNPNPQYDYDHRQDQALFLDSSFVQKKLREMRNAYEEYKELASLHAGPACIETFGEKIFEPVNKMQAFSLSKEQQQLQAKLDNESGQIVNRYIKGEERSFTIIAFPLPEIGERFPEIFDEIIRINTLDYEKYRRIQQTIIDTLDTCEWVEVKGRGGNETDLLIHLHTLERPGQQTNFENCLADVNIPVGEVFTSPVLAGTGGILHVSKVYLNGLLFKNLKLVFDCGQVIDYTCENFSNEDENLKYIEDNILFHHPKLPMGEFAIGTNTTAYAAAEKYQIGDKLPILIAEKMGPHFAVGDTCYSYQEDTSVYNPDGKEIIARDNEISEMRKEDPDLAYYGCHTDITLPYDELGSIRVIDDDGEMTSIIENGRFVLPGTEELNEPLDHDNSGK